ncbi:hypothetical protein [Hymenobacter jejuensis]|uniref:Uncharacterized protein n=1 Tax=Hymenobacter jejuensis TaxID=2502781 RepID=A0A5B7ZYI9_9BACT|nr:hypothetical protein [Hymenobacter jejuensis]QDA59513.1 hypothetical protein FHG12_05065 [Hymenobacter jejuensis]
MDNPDFEVVTTLTVVRRGIWMPDYELQNGEIVVGTLKRQSIWQPLTEASTPAQSWTFKRIGCFHRKITVRPAGAPTNSALVSRQWNGQAEIVFANGKQFYFRKKSFWSTTWQWRTETGEVLAELRRTFTLTPQVGLTRLSALGTTLPEAPLLCLLGWHLIRIAAGHRRQ